MRGFFETLSRKANKENAALLSPVRMQALGVLQIALEHAMKKQCILTQVSVQASPPIADEAGFHCNVYVKAFFFWAGKSKEHGREGAAPLPPQVVAKITMRSDRGRVLQWEIPRFYHVQIDNVGDSPWKYESFVDYDGELERKIKDFADEFNKHRPWGFAIMPENHDKVIWQINPQEDTVPADLVKDLKS